MGEGVEDSGGTKKEEGKDAHNDREEDRAFADEEEDS